MAHVYDSDKYRAVPALLKTDHKYCAVCGLEMRYSRTKNNGGTFNKRTGARTAPAESYTHKWICQSGEEGHDNVVFVPL